MVISLHGGLIRSRQRYPVGTLLEIRMQHTQHSARARVVWTGTATSDLGIEVAFEIMEPLGFWQFRFPPDRWSGTSSKAPC